MGDPCVLQANHVGRVADDVTVSIMLLADCLALCVDVCAFQGGSSDAVQQLM